jgi:Leucine-rich repeat (LRR) protein
LANDFFEWSPALQAVNVYGNNLTGTLPSSLQKLSDLLYLDVSHNNLTGTLAASLVESWSQLEQLYVEYNHFHGTLPPQLGKLTKLQQFSAEHNRFSGSIPTFSWSVTTVGTSNSGDSTGTVTSEVFAPLQQLLLAQNRFTGPLPATLPRTMQYADFALNRLNGTCPPAWLVCSRRRLMYL